jgi:ABC-type antimicrobial peptide transport system permease subunit
MRNEQGSNAGLGLGIAGSLLGIISFVIAIFCGALVISLISGIFGVAFSIVGLNQAKKANAGIGIILIALILSIFACAYTTFKMTDFNRDSDINVINKNEQDIQENESEIELQLEKKLEELEKCDTTKK